MRIFLLMSALLCLACGRTELVHYTFPPGEPPDAGLVPCVTGLLTPEPSVPAVMLVVDRSGSMEFDLAGNDGSFNNPLTGPSRWTVLKASLETTLTQFDEQVSFGLVQFPGNNLCGVSASIDLLPRPGNASAVMSRLTRSPGGGTPTFQAVTNAAGQLRAVQGQALVLITDGEPNCNEDLDPATCDCTLGTRCLNPTNCRDQVRTTEGIRVLRDENEVVTYVVGVGSSSPTVVTTLDNMALAGGVPRMGGARSFYSGATEPELSEALTAISTRLTRCTWATGTRLDVNDLVVVTVGGQVVPHGALGWDWVDPSVGNFSLRGMWCERAANGEAVQVRLECR